MELQQKFNWQGVRDTLYEFRKINKNLKINKVKSGTSF